MISSLITMDDKMSIISFLNRRKIHTNLNVI